jgi:small subunit ribosomal protein S6
MRFDSDGRAQHMVRRTMSLDPRLLRYSIVKMGNKLDEISDVGGQAEEWGNVQGSEGTKWSETTEGRGVGHDPYRIYFK